MTRGENSSSMKKPSYGFSKKKEGDTNVVIQERRVNPTRRNHKREAFDSIPMSYAELIPILF